MGVDVVGVGVEPGGLFEEGPWLSGEDTGCSDGDFFGSFPLASGMEGTLISVALGLFGWVVTRLISPSVVALPLPLWPVFVLEPVTLDA